MKYTAALLLLISTQANAGELTYSFDPQYKDRNEAWLYKTIKAHQVKPQMAFVSESDVLPIDGNVAAVQITSDSEYRDLVQAVLKREKH